MITETINHLELAPHPTSTARGTHPRTSRGNHDNTRGSTPKVVRPKNLKQGAGLPVVLPGTNQTVTPGEVTASGASFLSSLPTPLLAILAGAARRRARGQRTRDQQHCPHSPLALAATTARR